jgi:mRNA interferase HigB
MTLVGQDVLTTAGKKNSPLRKGLLGWAATVEAAEWHSLDDVRRSYASADGVKLGSGTVVTVFNVKGNVYRLLSWIDYDLQSVEALEVLSHAEYDKDQWKERY